jgi:hypothetical protein
MTRCIFVTPHLELSILPGWFGEVELLRSTIVPLLFLLQTNLNLSFLPLRNTYNQFIRYNCTMQSQACCTVPPVISKGYEAKGTYTTIDGMKTYTTGPSDAKKALLVIYDIFGFKDQTIQGADILATSDKENQYQVFMPDFFEGKPVDISDYPPDTVRLAPQTLR